MTDAQAYAQNPLVLLIVIGEYALPVLAVIGICAVLATTLGVSRPRGLLLKPALRRMDVREVILKPPLRDGTTVELTGKLVIGKYKQAWLESTDAASAADAIAPKLRIDDPVSVEAILAVLPALEDETRLVNAFAWVRGRFVGVNGNAALVGITRGAVHHGGKEYDIENLRWLAERRVADLKRR